MPAPALEPRAGSRYAGVGSRATPAPALALMRGLAEALGRLRCVLRTGLSPGADQAFYAGALAAHGVVELYLPWPGFEADARARERAGAVRVLERPTREAYELAAAAHPGWGALADSERHLRARDAHEILGPELDTPAAFVVCWTPCASLDGEEVVAEGTGQALRIARAHSVPVLNLARAQHARLAAGLAVGLESRSS